MKKNHRGGITRLNLLTVKASITSFALIILLVTSCNKKDSNPCQTDVAHLSGTYKITGFYYRTSASSPEIDATNTILPNACERDNLMVLNSNGTYQLVDAGVVCSPSSADSGVWSINGTTIYIDADAEVIESFDCKTLSVSKTNVNQNGDRLRMVLTKQ